MKTSQMTGANDDASQQSWFGQFLNGICRGLHWSMLFC